MSWGAPGLCRGGPGLDRGGAGLAFPAPVSERPDGLHFWNSQHVCFLSGLAALEAEPQSVGLVQSCPLGLGPLQNVA